MAITADSYSVYLGSNPSRPTFAAIAQLVERTLGMGEVHRFDPDLWLHGDMVKQDHKTLAQSSPGGSTRYLHA